MTEQHDPHPADATVGDRGKPDEHGAAAVRDDGHGGHDDGHGGEALGPLDVTMWGAGILGIALGMVVLLGFIWALR